MAASPSEQERLFMSKQITAFASFLATISFVLLCSAPAHADNCGNGSLQPGEVCDEGGSNSTQDTGCCAAGCASFVSSATVCRPAAGGLCDTVAESCSGTSGTCPADIVSPNTVVCRPSLAGVCDSAENCTGSTPTCPVDTFASNSTVCRPAAGACDSVENCTGSSGACPSDSKSNAVCRPLQGICDVAAETCNGTSNDCPSDTAQNAGVVCRASDGECDLAETCTGTSSSCPADLHKTSVCRPSQGVCDLAESCDGTADHCPADSKSSAVCRPAVNPACDVAESCNGTSNTCPEDQLVGCADNDGVACTEAICLSNGDCAFAENCTEICRGTGFWKTHAGDEMGHPNLVQQILDQTGGLEICGVNVTDTTTLGSMTSFLENICVLVKNNDTLKLDRVLATTAVNCAISEGGTCDQILDHLGFTVTYSDCSALC